MTKSAQPAPRPPAKTAATGNKVPAAQSPKAAPPPLQEKLPTGEQKGFIVMVNPKEGYGFIRPEANRNVEGKDVHFALRWMHKDLTYALAAGTTLGAALPTVATVRELFALAMLRGLSDADYAAVTDVVRG